MLTAKKSNLSLITAAKLGNKEAFDQLVKNCYKKLLGFIISRVTFESKEDLAQETLVEAYKNLFRFKGNSSFSTLL